MMHVDAGWLFSARPGRPPKRSTVNSTPDALDNMKKSRGIINSMSSTDYFSPVNHIIGMYASPIVTDRISVRGNAIASVRSFPHYFRNQLTVDLELLRASRS